MTRITSTGSRSSRRRIRVSSRVMAERTRRRLRSCRFRSKRCAPFGSRLVWAATVFLRTTSMIPTLLIALLAHDFWIEPNSFTPTVGQIVKVRMLVGQDLLGDPVAIDPALVKHFVE